MFIDKLQRKQINDIYSKTREHCKSMRKHNVRNFDNHKRFHGREESNTISQTDKIPKFSNLILTKR
jgi:hypothetical protein